MNLFIIICFLTLLFLFVFLSRSWMINKRKDFLLPTGSIVFTALLYLYVGSPSTQSMKIITSANEAKLTENIINTNDNIFSSTDIDEMISKLEQNLEKHEDNLNGWILLARSYFDKKNYKKSIYAYEKALDLSPDQPDLLADLADATTMDNNGVVTTKIKNLLAHALEIDPNHNKTLALLATFSMRENDTNKAISYWSQLKESVSENSFNKEKIEQIIKSLKAESDSELAIVSNSIQKKIIKGEVYLSGDALAFFDKHPISSKTVIFIIAKGDTSNPMPIAVSKIELLPFLDLFSKNKKINFEISDLNSMIKNRNLSQFKVIRLQAKLSYQGSVIPKIGDLFSEEVLVKNTTEKVNLSLSKVNSKDNN